MTARVLSVVTAASLVVLLAGCTSHEPPPSYTDAELDVYFDKRIDAAWANTGLDGTVERPVLDRDVAANAGTENLAGFNGCLTDLGMDSWGVDERNGGPVFLGSSGGVLTPDLQLEFYRCFAEFPSSEYYSRVILTKDQKEYLYDFYLRWTVPCLQVNGYTILDPPTRSDFLNAPYDWLPYYSVDPGDAGFDSSDLKAMVELCGDPYADLDVDHPQWY